METIEGLSLTVRQKIPTAMSMEHGIPTDEMRHWRFTLRTAVHSSWATLEGVMAVIGEGARIDHRVAHTDVLATTITGSCIKLMAALIGKRTIVRCTTIEDVVAVTEGAGTVRRAAYTSDLATDSIEYGTNLPAALEDEWIVVHCTTVESTVGLDTDIHGAYTHPNFEVAVHMREVALVDSTETAFGGCTCGGRAAVLRTVVHYSETVSANMFTVDSESEEVHLSHSS